MIEKGADYSFAPASQADRGWVFCPEYTGAASLEITPSGWETRVFLFGPGRLPDSGFQRETYNESDPVVRNGLPTAAGLNDAESEKPMETPGSPQGCDTRPLAEPSQSDHAEADAVQVEPSIVLGTDLMTGAKVSWPLTIKGNPHLLVAGLPGMAVPAGLDPQGLPLGLQLIGRPFEEETLFALGEVIEQAAGRFKPAKWW